jgi:hypothetical protein
LAMFWAEIEDVLGLWLYLDKSENNLQPANNSLKGSAIRKPLPQ